MWRYFAGFLIGLGLGVIATVWVESRPWLRESVREQLGRDWIGALSGWFAFLAAAFSLPFLVGQWREARKQTRFAIGDEEPTLDVIEHTREGDILVVRIVNWNRRAVFVNEVEITPTADGVEGAVWNVEGRNGEIGTGFPLQLAGWEDRGGPPQFARIDLVLRRRIQGSEPGAWTDEIVDIPRNATVTAKLRMLGNVHRVFSLDARAFPDG